MAEAWANAAARAASTGEEAEVAARAGESGAAKAGPIGSVAAVVTATAIATRRMWGLRTEFLRTGAAGVANRPEARRR
ncbi:hypothetical protein GCM10010317_063150 [Streptomyces mirabilis]|nr:hypothetical protein GCM10010317_063150 [Streptomyces mirabilis]